MRDQVGAAHATSWDNLWGGLRSARNALNSSHTGRKPRPPLWAATIRDTPDRAVPVLANEKSAVMRHRYAKMLDGDMGWWAAAKKRYFTSGPRVAALI